MRTNYGVGNYGSWSNSGTVQASYSGNTQTPLGLMYSPSYGASFASNDNFGSWGRNNYVCGNRCQSYQPSYTDFLRYGICPGQNRLAALRDQRNHGEYLIGSLDRRGGFFGGFPVPRDLYGIT